MTLYKWSQTASADATADSTINWARRPIAVQRKRFSPRHDGCHGEIPRRYCWWDYDRRVGNCVHGGEFSTVRHPCSPEQPEDRLCPTCSAEIAAQVSEANAIMQ